MRRIFLITALVMLAVPFAMAGAGGDQPFNITATSPYNGNLNQAQVCWNTTKPSDSLLMIGEDADFSRWIYDPTLTTNHCVVVQNLEPASLYYFSVASCTDPVGGQPCATTDVNWSVAPWPGTPSTFTTALSTSGNLGFNAFTWGPNYVYQGSGINVGVSMIQTGGVVNSKDVLILQQATIDGESCLPGTLLGAPCGDTNISFTLLCSGPREEVNPQTDNYPVWIYGGGNYVGDYVCWNSYFNEPGVQARIVPFAQSKQQRSGSPKHGGDAGHNLSMTFQLIDYTTNIPIGDPQTVTWQFSVLPPAQFTITPPTTYPPIPNLNQAVAIGGQWGPYQCEQFKSWNQQGIYLNSDLTVYASVNDMWDIYTYDGNRVYKEGGDRFDGVSGGTWQPHHAYNVGDVITFNGNNQVVVKAGYSADFIPPFNPQPSGLTPDHNGLMWANAGNKAYWNACSEIIGTQYLNWADNIAKFTTTKEWNIFPWGMYMDFQRQDDTLSENCIDGQACTGLNASSNLRFGANILTYPASGYYDQNFPTTYYEAQTGTVRGLPFNTNVALVDWLETGVEPTNELTKRVDMLIQTISEAIKYNPLEGSSHYACCYNTPNWNIGLWAMTLIHTYDVEQYMNTTPDARIPIELLKLLDWFYSNQFNLMGNDYTSPYQPWVVPYNCSIFTQYNKVQGATTHTGQKQANNCWNSGWSKNDLIAPAYAWLGAMYGDNCKLPTSGVGCWVAADQFFGNAWQGYDFTARNFNQLFQDYSNYVGWRSGTFPPTDSYVLPTHNPLEGPYPDVIGPYPSGNFPAKAMASNISNSGATITWYTYEKAVSTVVNAGTDPNNLNLTTNCGPSVYTGADNLWINTCDITGLQPSTQYYFGVGGTDAARNYAFSALDPTVNLSGVFLTFTTTQ